jgi:hypothetical protein
MYAAELISDRMMYFLLLLTANGFSPGGSGTTIRQQTKYKLTTIRQHTPGFMTVGLEIQVILKLLLQ